MNQSKNQNDVNFVKYDNKSNIQQAQVRAQYNLQYEYDMYQIRKEIKNAIPESLYQYIKQEEQVEQKNIQGSTCYQEYKLQDQSVIGDQKSNSHQNYQTQNQNSDDIIYQDLQTSNISQSRQDNLVSPIYSQNQVKKSKSLFESYTKKVENDRRIEQLIKTTKQLLVECKETLALDDNSKDKQQTILQNKKLIVQLANSKINDLSLNDTQYKSYKHDKVDQSINYQKNLSLRNQQRRKFKKQIEQQLKDIEQKEQQMDNDIDNIFAKLSVIQQSRLYH